MSPRLYIVMQRNLIQKYNIPGPRYTSYPTVPYWDDDSISPGIWKDTIDRVFSESNTDEGISLYIHLPYCESLCTFCGSHKHITKRHSVEIPYDEDRVIRQHILNIMCHFETIWDKQDSLFPELVQSLLKLEEMEADGLVELSEQKLVVLEVARPFVRKICMAFDLRLIPEFFR